MLKNKESVQSDLEIARDQILPKIMELYPNSQAVALSGSRASGSSHKHSDWDFVIIDNSRQDGLIAGDEVINGFHCELFVASYQEWIRIIKEKPTNNVPVFLQMVCESLPLMKTDEYERLIEEAKHIFDAGPAALTNKDIDWHIQQIDFAIDKINGVGLTGRPLFKHGIMQSLLDTWYICQNCWRVKPVQRDNFIKETSPVFYDQLLRFQACDFEDDEEIAIELFNKMREWLRNRKSIIA